jgi:hypothetical protein
LLPSRSNIQLSWWSSDEVVALTRTGVRPPVGFAPRARADRLLRVSRDCRPTMDLCAPDSFPGSPRHALGKSFW